TRTRPTIRAWALDPGVAEAMRLLKHMRPNAEDDDHVFLDEYGRPVVDDHLADRFREHLKAAGIDRKQLYEHTGNRRGTRLHDTRATFVTIALAKGRSEAWVADRTGHRSSQQISTYRRAARSVAEPGLGDLYPLALAIPELRDRGGERETGPETGPDLAR